MHRVSTQVIVQRSQHYMHHATQGDILSKLKKHRQNIDRVNPQCFTPRNETKVEKKSQRKIEERDAVRESETRTSSSIRC